MSKSINVILNLKDQFTSPLKKATASAKASERTFKMGMNNIKKTGAKLGSLAVKGIAVGTAAITASTGIFLQQSVAAYNEATVQTAKMESVLKNTKGMTKSNIAELDAYTGVLQRKGVVEDDVIKAGITSVGVYGLQAETIKKLLPGMTDLVAKEKGLNATGEDMANIGKLIGKAMSGQTGALKKAGIVLDKHQEIIMKTGTESQKAALLSELLSKKVGGVNSELANTPQGKIQQIKNEFGDFQEEIGAIVLPILGDFASWFNSQIPVMKEKIFNLVDAFNKFATENKPLLDNLKTTILGVGTAILNIGEFIITNFSTIGPIIGIATTAFVAYKTVTMASATASFLFGTAEMIKNKMIEAGYLKINAITVAQWAWNAAMNANPIGVVIALIAGLVAIGFAVYKNWDKIKAQALSLWNVLMTALKPAIDMVKGAFDAIMGTINNVVVGFNRVKDSIGGAIGKLLNWNSTKVENKNANFNTNTSGGVKTPGRKALGTSYFKGGLTQINENKRSETVILPNGTEILSHEQSKKQGNNTGNIKVEVNVSGNVIGNEEYANYLGNEIIKKIMKVYKNI